MPGRLTWMAVCAATLVVAAPYPAVAGEPCEQAACAPDRPRIGLVLSGGGARGAAHAGILKVLERHRIPVDYIAGTSFGALVGGLYATGMSPDEITEWIKDFDWQAALVDRPPRRSLSVRRKQDDYTYALRPRLGFRNNRLVLPRGLLSGQVISFLLRIETIHTTEWQDFDDFPIPFRAVATDIETGEAVVLDHGSLADAMLASMAVPGVIAPMELDRRLLLDGGLVDNLPVEVVRSLGADIVIAVDVTSPLTGRETLEDVLGVSAQVINLVGQQNMQRAIASLNEEDVFVRPDLSGIGSADFELMEEAIERGLAAEPVLARRLKALSVGEAEWEDWLDTQRVPNREWPVIDFIEVDNSSDVADELINARITQTTGQRLSLSRLRRDLTNLYSIGEFNRIVFDIVEREGRTGLRITVIPNEIGPNYLRFGLNIQDDLDGDGAYNMLMLHTRTQVNRLNGEWRNEIQIGETRRFASQLYQPVNWRGDFFVNPKIAITRTNFDLFDAAGNRIAEYRLGVDALSVDAGWQWQNIGEITVGAFREDVEASPRIGDPSLQSFYDTLGGWQWSLTADQLDSWTFPADAWYVELNGRHARNGFGGVRKYGRVDAIALWAWALNDRDRLLWSTRVGGRVNGTLPIYEQFGIGGFLSISGLRRDELRGDYVFGTRVVFYRRMFRLPTALGDGFYAGLSHERGNVWNSRDAAGLDDLRWGNSAFIGADLVFGALYLGIGRADNGDTAGYLFLQRSFQ